MFIALLISVLLLPCSLLMENKANRGNVHASPRKKWNSGPSRREPRCPREHVARRGFCLRIRRHAGPLMGTETGSSAQNQWQNMATEKIITNHKSAWCPYKTFLTFVHCWPRRTWVYFTEKFPCLQGLQSCPDYRSLLIVRKNSQPFH